jgi:hypothetical protein
MLFNNIRTMFNKEGNLKEMVSGLIRIAPSLGVLQFIILTFLAVLFYPGGFDLYNQYFSELGATISRNGELNKISSSLFLIANLVVGLALIPFWLEIPSIISGKHGMKVAGKFASMLGLMSSPFIIAAALYPIDTHLTMHYQMFLVFFPLFNVASLLCSMTLLLARRSKEKYGILGLLLFAISIMVMLNPSAAYVSFLQKILLYGYFIWVLMLNRVVSSHFTELTHRIKS